jgi:hypothetical protein
LQYYNLVLTTSGAFLLFFIKKILSFSEKKLGFLGWSVVAGFSSVNSTNLLIFWKYWKKILYPNFILFFKKTTGQWVRVALRFLIGQELGIFMSEIHPPPTPKPL